MIGSNYVTNGEEFSGRENPLVFTRYYEKIFNCDFKLERYPFDSQVCYMQVTLNMESDKRYGGDPGEVFCIK